MDSHAIQAATRELEARLRAQSDPARSVQEKRYLKSPSRHAGVAVPQVRRTTRAWSKELVVDPGSLAALTSAMWRSEWYEVRLAAVELLVIRRKELDATWFARVRDLIDSTFTWALVDPLSTDVVGHLLLAHDRTEWEPILDAWSADPNFWVRRASMLSQLKPLRDPSFDAGLFFGYADAMLEEKEFFVRKAIGWVLRDMSRTRPEEVETWLRPRIARMSTVSYREAVKYISPEARDEFAAVRAR